MTDKTDLIERLLETYAEYATFDDGNGGDVINIFHLKNLTDHIIKSDEAREYWREHDTDEPNVLLATHIKRLKTEKKRFVEQACDAIDNVHNPCQAVSTPAFMRIRADIKKSIEEL